MLNVYLINGHWIAAKSVNEAVEHYLEDFEFGELGEGDEEWTTISVRRVRAKELTIRDIPCCEDECKRCKEKGEVEYDSLQDIIDKKTDFPCTLAREF